MFQVRVRFGPHPSDTFEPMIDVDTRLEADVIADRLRHGPRQWRWVDIVEI